MFAVLAAAVLFGTTGTAQALGPEGTTPLSIGVMRMVVGGSGLAVLAFALAAAHRRRIPTATQPRLNARAGALMVLTGVCLTVYQPLFFLGTERNGVAVGTMIALGSAPILAGVLEWALTRRRPSPVWIAATATATAGVILLGAGGSTTSSTGTDVWGLVGSVGAGASFAIIANAQRRLLDDGWDPFTVVGAMGASSAILAALAVPFVDLGWLGTTAGWVMTLWLGLATISIAYVMFTWGLSGLTAATAATLTLGEPLTASLLGVGVLGERLAPLALAGIAALAAGLALLAWGSRTPRDPRPFAVEG